MRVLLDRAAASYKDIYRQRTCTERINAQATDLGIERPKVCNGASVRTLNTLTYIIINLRALLRIAVVPSLTVRPVKISVVDHRGTLGIDEAVSLAHAAGGV